MVPINAVILNQATRAPTGAVRSFEGCHKMRVDKQGVKR